MDTRRYPPHGRLHGVSMGDPIGLKTKGGRHGSDFAFRLLWQGKAIRQQKCLQIVIVTRTQGFSDQCVRAKPVGSAQASVFEC